MNDDVTRVLLLPVQVQHVQLLREHAAHRRRRQERRGGLLRAQAGQESGTAGFVAIARLYMLLTGQNHLDLNCVGVVYDVTCVLAASLSR